MIFSHLRTTSYNCFRLALSEYGLNNCVKVIRARSVNVEPPSNIGFMVLDGNHGPTAITDARRFGGNVIKGGFLYADDIGWSGGNVGLAVAALKDMGFVERYAIETGVMLQRL